MILKKLKLANRKLMVILAIASLILQFSIMPIVKADDEIAISEPVASVETKDVVKSEIAPIVAKSEPTPEMTPTDEPAIEPEATPTIEPTPTAISTPIVEVLTTPAPTPTSENIAPENIETPESIWQVDGAKATTTHHVELNTLYTAPQNDQVTVEFTKLPEKPGHLSIEEIKLSDSQMATLNTSYNKAYDITSDMTDGSFEYTLTLPKTNQAAGISYLEKSVSEFNHNIDKEDIKPIDSDNIKLKSNTIEAKDINHFTIFVTIADWNFDDSTALADSNSLNQNLAKNVSVVGSSFSNYITGVSGKAINANSWNSGGDKYWQAEVNTTGYENLKLSSFQKSSPTGPKDFKVQYKIGSDSWIDIPGGVITVSPSNFTSGTINELVLPIACNNQSNLFIRWLKNSEVSANDLTIGSTGTNAIDNINIQGSTIVLPTLTSSNITADGNVIGNLADGAVLTTRNGSSFHPLDVANVITADGDLPAQNYAFNLQADEAQKTELKNYFAAKDGWNSDMINQINAEIEGTAPFFYLKSAGAAGYSLIDGFKKAMGLGDNPLVIDDNYPTGTYIYTGEISGQTKTISLTVNRADITPPVITIDPYDTNPTNQDIIVTASTNEGTLNAISYTFTENGSFDFVATDAAGNVSTQTVTITNIDKTAPVIDSVTSAPDTTGDASTITVNAHDNIAIFSVKININGTGYVSMTGTGPYTYEYLLPNNDISKINYSVSLTDTVGNITTNSYGINPIDDESPVITLIGDNEVTVERTNSYIDAGATALDNIDGDITTAIIPTNNVNTDLIGDYTVTYNVSDNNLNPALYISRTVHVIDTVAPVITIDQYNTNLTNQDIIVTASTNEGTLNQNLYTFTENGSFDFVATDAAGNVSTQTVTITNIDKTAPVITLNGDSNIDIMRNSTYTDAGATALDNTDGNITGSIQIVGQVDTSIPGTYLITYNVSDSAGNAATEVTRTVNVILENNQVAPDLTGNATLNATQNQLVVTDSETAVNVQIDDKVTNPSIDYSEFLEGSSVRVPQTNINSSILTVQIPWGTTITSDNQTWDGILAAPTLTTVDLPTVEGKTETLSSALELGFAGGKLTFDQAVRLVLPGAAGQKVGYTREGEPFTEITNICAVDDQATGDGLAAGGDCKIDVGQDLVIWTKHFTKFAAYTEDEIKDGDLDDNADNSHHHKKKTVVNPIVTVNLPGQTLVGGLGQSNPLESTDTLDQKKPDSTITSPEPVKDVLGAANDNPQLHKKNFLIWYILGGVVLAFGFWFFFIKRDKNDKKKKKRTRR